MNFPRPPTPACLGDANAFTGQLRDIISSVCPVSAPGPPPTGTCPDHLTRNNLNLLPLMWTSNSCTLSPIQMALLTLSLKERPTTLPKTLIFGEKLVYNLFLSVTTHRWEDWHPWWTDTVSASPQPQHQSNCRSPTPMIPSLMNKAPRYLISSTWGNNSSLTLKF